MMGSHSVSVVVEAIRRGRNALFAPRLLRDKGRFRFAAEGELIYAGYAAVVVCAHVRIYTILCGFFLRVYVYDSWYAHICASFDYDAADFFEFHSDDIRTLCLIKDVRTGIDKCVGIPI